MWCLHGYYFKMAPGIVRKAIDLTWTTKAQNKAREIAQPLVITSDCNDTSQLSLFRRSDLTMIDDTKCDTTECSFAPF